MIPDLPPLYPGPPSRHNDPPPAPSPRPAAPAPASSPAQTPAQTELAAWRAARLAADRRDRQVDRFDADRLARADRLAKAAAHRARLAAKRTRWLALSWGVVALWLGVTIAWALCVAPIGAPMWTPARAVTLADLGGPETLAPGAPFTLRTPQVCPSCGAVPCGEAKCFNVPVGIKMWVPSSSPGGVTAGVPYCSGASSSSADCRTTSPSFVTAVDIGFSWGYRDTYTFFPPPGAVVEFEGTMGAAPTCAMVGATTWDAEAKVCATGPTPFDVIKVLGVVWIISLLPLGFTIWCCLG